MKNKIYFPLFLDWAPIFENLNNEECSILMKALYTRFFDNKIPKIENPKIKRLYTSFADRIIDYYKTNQI